MRIPWERDDSFQPLSTSQQNLLCIPLPFIYQYQFSPIFTQSHYSGSTHESDWLIDQIENSFTWKSIKGVKSKQLTGDFSSWEHEFEIRRRFGRTQRKSKIRVSREEGVYLYYYSLVENDKCFFFFFVNRGDRVGRDGRSADVDSATRLLYCVHTCPHHLWMFLSNVSKGHLNASRLFN